MPTAAPAANTRAVRLVRGGLAALSAYAAAIGMPALSAPAWFYRSFPLGRGWVAQLPPYNEHLVRDAGALFLGFAVLLGLAATRPRRDLVRGALAAWTVTAVPHLLFHAIHPSGLTSADAAAQLTLLGVGVVLPLLLLRAARALPRLADHPS